MTLKPFIILFFVFRDHTLIHFPKVRKESFKEVESVCEIGHTHDFAATVHGKLRHAGIDGPNASQCRNGWTNRAATGTVVADYNGIVMNRINIETIKRQKQDKR
jgi:hypothetical protein